MKQLTKAVLAVMKDVKGIEKNMTIGVGQNSYKGVADKDVKKTIGEAMQKHGLIILPIAVENGTQVDRWEEETKFGVKNKQQVFTEVKNTYRLMHESGEFMDIVGLGHGIDTQDKSAGKAMTYSLKMLLLHTFLVPTGDMDESGVELPTPPKPKPQAAPTEEPAPEQAPLSTKHEDWDKVKDYVSENKDTDFDTLIKRLSKRYKIAKATERSLKKVHES